jgi:DNA-directed RNA polymerase specialized sigma24 family protein
MEREPITDRADGADHSTAAAYESLRPLLFSIAYRMVGSVTEAEDIVQEAFLRYHRAVPLMPTPFLWNI